MKTAGYFSAALLLAAVVSCSRNDLLSVQGDHVELRVSVNSGTRASETSMATLDHIYLSAFAYSGDSLEDYIEPDTRVDVYSDGSCVSPDFYVPANQDLIIAAYGFSNGVSEEKQKDQILGMDWDAINYYPELQISIKPSPILSEQIDFVFDVRYPDFLKGNVVNLDMAHLESQVALLVRNTDPGLEFRVKSWSLRNVALGGSLKLGYNYVKAREKGTRPHFIWDGSDEVGAYTDTLPSVASITYSSTYAPLSGSESMIIIPQSLGLEHNDGRCYDENGFMEPSYLCLTMQVLSRDGAQLYPEEEGEFIDCCWPLAGLELDPGKKNIFTVDLSGGGYQETGEPFGQPDPILPEKNEISVGYDIAPWGGEYVKDSAADTVLQKLFSTAIRAKVKFSPANLWVDTAYGELRYHFENSQFDYRHSYCYFGEQENGYHTAFIDTVKTDTPAGTVGSFFFNSYAEDAASLWNAFRIPHYFNGSDEDPLFTDTCVFGYSYEIMQGIGVGKITVNGKPWRSLSINEMQFLIGGYPTEACQIIRGGKSAPASVSLPGVTVKGLVLLPDEWELPEGCDFYPMRIDSLTGGFNGVTILHYSLEEENEYSLDEWKKMESNGAVFFSVGGFRENTWCAPEQQWPDPLGDCVLTVRNAHSEACYLTSDGFVVSTEFDGKIRCSVVEQFHNIDDGDNHAIQGFPLRLVRTEVYLEN